MSRKLKIVDVDAETNAEILKFCTEEKEGYIRVGEAGYLFPARMRNGLQQVYNLSVRPTDVYVTSFPRSGTTWTQEMVWLLQNNLNFEKAKSTPLTNRYTYIEFSFYQRPDLLVEVKEKARNEDEHKRMLKELQVTPLEDFESNAGPRFIKSHLALSILPSEVLDKAKMVFIARDPRDVAVSFYHLHNLMNKLTSFVGDFKNFWRLLIEDKIFYTPLFSVIKEAWNKRHHPNLLFLFYEDLVKDLPSAIRQVSNFLGKSLSDDQLNSLCEHLKFENFSKNKAVTYAAMEENGMLKGGEGFIRKGKAGGWREYFDAEMTEQANRWIADNLRDTDLRFPEPPTTN